MVFYVPSVVQSNYTIILCQLDDTYIFHKRPFKVKLPSFISA